MNSFAESLQLLWTRRFGTFCCATFLSNIGTWAQQVAEPWLLLTLGASGFLIGLDSFAMAAPVWALTLLGGRLADRADRRLIFSTCQSLQMMCPIAIVVLLLCRVVQPWMVIALSVVVGITDAISLPSFQSIVPSIVEHDQIASGLALNATQFNLSRVLGPALAGVLMAGVGAIGCFALNAASYLPFIWVALWILPRGKPAAAIGGATEEDSIYLGIRSIVRNRNLRGALLTVLLTSVLCGPLIVFCPVLVKTEFNANVAGFSVAVTAFGLGGLLGSIALLGVGPGQDRGRICSWFARCYGAILVVTALNLWFWAFPVLLALAGVAMTVSNTSANTLLQASATPELRGQTVSLYMLAMRGGVSVGSLLTGLAVNLIGVRDALLIDGILALAGQIVVGHAWLSGKPEPTSLT